MIGSPLLLLVCFSALCLLNLFLYLPFQSRLIPGTLFVWYTTHLWTVDTSGKFCLLLLVFSATCKGKVLAIHNLPDPPPPLWHPLIFSCWQSVPPKLQFTILTSKTVWNIHKLRNNQFLPPGLQLTPSPPCSRAPLHPCSEATLPRHLPVAR